MLGVGVISILTSFVAAASDSTGEHERERQDRVLFCDGFSGVKRRVTEVC